MENYNPKLSLEQNVRVYSTESKKEYRKVEDKLRKVSQMIDNLDKREKKIMHKVEELTSKREALLKSNSEQNNILEIVFQGFNSIYENIKKRDKDINQLKYIKENKYEQDLNGLREELKDVVKESLSRNLGDLESRIKNKLIVECFLKEEQVAEDKISLSLYVPILNEDTKKINSIMEKVYSGLLVLSQPNEGKEIKEEKYLRFNFNKDILGNTLLKRELIKTIEEFNSSFSDYHVEFKVIGLKEDIKSKRKRFERATDEEIIKTLLECKGNRLEAAKLLGYNYPSLCYRIGKLYKKDPSLREKLYFGHSGMPEVNVTDEQIIDILKECNGNKTRAANKIGLADKFGLELRLNKMYENPSNKEILDDIFKDLKPYKKITDQEIVEILKKHGGNLKESANEAGYANLSGIYNRINRIYKKDKSLKELIGNILNERKKEKRIKNEELKVETKRTPKISDQQIIDTLTKYDWDRKKAAEILDYAYPTLLSRLSKIYKENPSIKDKMIDNREYRIKRISDNEIIEMLIKYKGNQSRVSDELGYKAPSSISIRLKKIYKKDPSLKDLVEKSSTEEAEENDISNRKKITNKQVVDTLIKYNGNKTKAAKELGYTSCSSVIARLKNIFKEDPSLKEKLKNLKKNKE